MKQGSKFKINNCHFDISIVGVDGTVRNCGSHYNLILDAGLINFLEGTGGFRRFRLGTGNAPVSRTQTSLEGQISGSAGSFLNVGNGVVTTGTDEGGDYVQWATTGTSGTFSSNTNIAEIGFSSDTGNIFCSRALIRNSEGTPTAISILAGELVVVTYNFRLYLPDDTVAGDIVVTTDGSAVLHAWESKPREGATLTIGNGPNLLFIYPTSNIWFTGNDVNTLNFTRSPPVLETYGASCVNYYNKAGNTGNTTVTRYKSSNLPLTLPVDITFTPSILVTSDQRARFEFTTYLVQDYD